VCILVILLFCHHTDSSHVLNNFASNQNEKLKKEHVVTGPRLVGLDISFQIPKAQQ
jgi:hypothetical protein